LSMVKVDERNPETRIQDEVLFKVIDCNGPSTT